MGKKRVVKKRGVAKPVAFRIDIFRYLWFPYAPDGSGGWRERGYREVRYSWDESAKHVERYMGAGRWKPTKMTWDQVEALEARCLRRLKFEIPD